MASTYYVSETGGATTKDGLSLSTAWDKAGFNTSGNWSSTPGTSGKISPGDTVSLNGTMSGGLVVQGGGASGNYITILAAAGMKFSAAVMLNAVKMQNVWWIILDGGAVGQIGGWKNATGTPNGIIESTANGTGLANQADSGGITIDHSNNIIVRGWTIQNLYVHLNDETDTNPPLGATGISLDENSGVNADILVTNNIIHDAVKPIGLGYGDPLSANWTIQNNTLYRCNWGIGGGDRTNTAVLTNLLIEGNWIYSFANWDVNDQYHHNGIYVWGGESYTGTLRDVTVRNNRIEGPYGGHATSSIFFSGLNCVGPILIYNNVLISETDGPSDANIDIALGNGGVARIYNNTIAGASSNNAMALSGAKLFTLGDASTFYVSNNLSINKEACFINYYTGKQPDPSTSPSGGLVTVYSDYNLAYNTPSGREFGKSTNGNFSNLTFAQWQALGYDAHSSYNLDPALSSAYVPVVAGAAFATGTSQSTYFTTDANGTARSGSWDLGAFVCSGVTCRNFRTYPYRSR